MVARGASPSPYMLIDAARYFNLKNPDKLFDLLDVRIGEQVGTGDVLAGKPRSARQAAALAGLREDVTTSRRGGSSFRNLRRRLRLEAGLNGTVVERAQRTRRGHRSLRRVLQGVWGNDRRTIGTLRHEPCDGMENIYGDVIDTQYRGAVVVTRRPLKRVSFQVIEDQGFIGVIAPSMEPDLIETGAEQSHAAILLTEGFGSQRMSNIIAQFLDAMEGRQATVDAVLPAPLETRRPEVIINVPIEPGERPPAPNLNAVSANWAGSPADARHISGNGRACHRLAKRAGFIRQWIACACAHRSNWSLVRKLMYHWRILRFLGHNQQ